MYEVREYDGIVYIRGLNTCDPFCLGFGAVCAVAFGFSFVEILGKGKDSVEFSFGIT